MSRRDEGTGYQRSAGVEAEDLVIEVVDARQLDAGLASRMMQLEQEAQRRVAMAAALLGETR